MSRRRRLVGAALAALTAVPLLSVPHHAAHAAVLTADVTRLSGPTRYSTAVQIAEAYMDHVDELPDTQQVDTVVIGSGLDEHVGWAAPVPLLARLERAPLVFTHPQDVPVPVEQFLQRRQVRRAILVGGTDVVSAAVADELTALGVEVVQRVGSNDVHQHAAAIARSFPQPAGEFPGKGRTALLATSGVFADALAAGPMAYRGQYPILLTPRDRLDRSAFDFLLASDIEHLIILGGTAAVGAAVQQQLAGLDFTIARITGNDRYHTAVKLAETQLKQLAAATAHPCYDGAELGLAYGGLPPDAIASGPLLGERCAPLLLTPADVLPRRVATFLRSDLYVTGNASNELDVTVFGGTSVVPDDVVSQFVKRATTLVPIGGRISAALDADSGKTSEFTVKFSSSIDAKRAAKPMELRMFSINSEPVFAEPNTGCPNGSGPDIYHGTARVSGNSIAVELCPGDDLEAGDVITVTGGQRIGINNSPRPLARFSYVIPTPDETVDRDAPAVEVGTRDRHQRYLVTLSGTSQIEAGDAMTVLRGSFFDESANASPRHRYVVPERGADFRIESVSVGASDNKNAASVTLDASTQLNATPSGSLKIEARSDGIAAGARGNAWRIYGTGLKPTSDDDDDDAEPEIGVSVETAKRLIRYVIQAGEPTFEDLASALSSDAVFAANFTVTTDSVGEDSTTIGGTRAAGVPLTGGGTAVGVRVRFNESVKVLLWAPDTQIPTATDCVDPSRDAGQRLLDLLVEVAPSMSSSDGCRLHFAAPDDVVHMRLSSPSAARLPVAGDVLFIDGNTATNYAGSANASQGWLTIRYDADVPVD